MKKLSFIFTFNLLLFFIITFTSTQTVFSNNGVYVSGQKNQQTISEYNKGKIHELIAKYTQQEILNYFIKHSSDILTRTVQKQSISIAPVFVYNSVQKCVLKVFEEKATSQLIQDSYTEILNKATDEFDENNLNQDQLQTMINRDIDKNLSEVFDNPVYQKIIEKGFEYIVNQQRQFIAHQYAQQQAKVVAAQKQYAAMQIAVKETMQKMLAQRYRQYQEYIVKKQQQKFQQETLKQQYMNEQKRLYQEQMKQYLP